SVVGRDAQGRPGVGLMQGDRKLHPEVVAGALQPRMGCHVDRNEEVTRWSTAVESAVAAHPDPALVGNPAGDTHGEFAGPPLAAWHPVSNLPLRAAQGLQKAD